jgi:hypothetical protein
MAKKRERPQTAIDQSQPTAPPEAVEATIVRANAERRTETSPSFASLYANDVQVQTSPWDLRLIFGEIANIPTKDDQAVTIKQVGEVRLSPQLAKKLTIILIEQLQGYEKRFGMIPIPRD